MKTRQSRRELVLFYPGESLHEQATAWGQRHDQCAVEPVFIKSAIGIRRFLERSDAAVLDASEDAEQAMAAFAEAVDCLGATSTAVYTERMCEGLEEFVRMRGALLLFGPLDDKQWDDLLERAFQARPQKRTWRMAA
jgi:hypothetical protein